MRRDVKSIGNTQILAINEKTISVITIMLNCWIEGIAAANVESMATLVVVVAPIKDHPVVSRVVFTASIFEIPFASSSRTRCVV